MATIINKTAPTPLIPLANPGGVSIPSSAMAAIESAMAHPHIGTNKVTSKKSKKKVKKQQKAAQAVQNDEVVEAEITEPVKEEAVIPEVTTPSVVIAHTEEKEATKAALPDERITGLYADFEGIKNEILTAHKNGAILPEGFAKAVREVADTIDAVEKVDIERRGVSIKKEVYGTGYSEPKYSVKECVPHDFVWNMPFETDEYIRVYIPLSDHKYLSGELGKYPSLEGRSVLQTISDNYNYISDTEFRSTVKGSAVLSCESNTALSGFIIYEKSIENTHRSLFMINYSMWMIDLAVPKDYYYSKIMSKPKVYVVTNDLVRKCDDDNDGVIDNIGNNAYEIGHALSFADVKELILSTDMKKSGSISNCYDGADAIDRATPYGITPDGNLLIYSNKFDR